MFPFPEQPSLDAWSDGRWTEDEFLAKGRWYSVWGYRWNYYREIFLHGRAARMPFVAINVPREVDIRGSAERVAARFPEDWRSPPTVDRGQEPGASDLLQGGVEDAGMHGGMPDGREVDAGGAVNVGRGDGLECDKGARARRRPCRRCRRARRFGPCRLRPRDRAPGTRVAHGSDRVGDADAGCRRARADSAVRASYANFVWGVAREASPAWPSLGVSTRAGDAGRRLVIDVEKDSPAGAGIENGDVILGIGGAAIDSREAMNRAIARYEWGDTATLLVKRGDAEVTVAVPLRRTP